MLPEDGDEDEDRGDEDDGQGDLRDGPRGEGLDLALGALGVGFFVPDGEGGEEEDADEGEDDGDDPGGGESVRVQRRACTAEERLGGRGKYSHQVREHNHVLKLARQPHQIQRVLVRRDLVRQRRRVVGAQPAPAVRVDADAEVADAGGEARVAGDGGHCAVRVVRDLRRVRDGLVGLVVERHEEDVGDEGGGGGAAGEEEGWEALLDWAALRRGGGGSWGEGEGGGLTEQYYRHCYQDHENMVVTQEWQEPYTR